MIPPKTLRKKVLEALAMAEGYGKTEAMIREMVGELTGGDADLQDVRNAMERHHGEALIRSERDEDNIVLWYLTPKGRARLNQG